ncbi:unnamed protein product [Protopolystoma xenopodis]|uniref:DOCKER domain-containing protein n=1 Tax=Protopolystoma xenopodis TaxID=117903 RepID=A0A448XDQ8_9PLAT|nr:unnamed protein product [Protopolystoma xenopodis]
MTEGCVGTTVNQGPAEVASVFLGPNLKIVGPPSSETYTPAHNRLRLCLKEFLSRSYDALCTNRNLVGPDQLEYQRELERNFGHLKLVMEPLLQAPRFTFPDPISLHLSYNSQSSNSGHFRGPTIKPNRLATLATGRIAPLANEETEG